MSLSYNAPSQSNLIQPDIEPDLEAGRGGAQAASKSSNATASSGQQGQMATAQREQSIWEQSACVLESRNKHNSGSEDTETK